MLAKVRHFAGFVRSEWRDHKERRMEIKLLSKARAAITKYLTEPQEYWVNGRKVHRVDLGKLRHLERELSIAVHSRKPSWAAMNLRKLRDIPRRVWLDFCDWLGV